MLELGTFGSVRGVPGDGYPYRNPRSIKVAQPKPALGQSGTSPFGAEPLLQTNCSRSASTDQRQLLLKPAVETCP